VKIASWNVNGIRACEQKGLLDWVKSEDPDVVCFQEVRAEPAQMSEAVVRPEGYEAIWHHATSKKGYSGVGVWTKAKPESVQIGCGNPEIDREGRVIAVTYKDFVLYNIYFPNGSRDLSRVPFKLAFYDYMLEQFDALHAQGKNLIVCGDYNTAHERIDLANPTANNKTTGFLPEEREWVTKYLAHGFRDVFRDRNPDLKGAYTWWSNRPGVREKNVGWRIDYFLVSAGLIPAVGDVSHRPEILGSDHCPVILEIISA
jgi:exodeoxyribonuclease-3